MSFKNHVILSVGMAVVLFLASGNSVHGGLINGSFENGMTGWTSAGPNSSVLNGAVNGFNATDGSRYASLSTGAGALSTVVHDFIFTQNSLPTVSSLFPDATEGATIFQTFVLGAGQNGVAFSWNFLTDEATPEPIWNDFAFALLYNQTTSSIAGTAYLDTFSNFTNFSGPQFSSETGWLDVTFIGLSAGDTFTLAFGVFDRGDTIVDSGLLIDNVRSIPEPSAGIIVGLVGVVVSGFRIRRRRGSV